MANAQLVPTVNTNGAMSRGPISREACWVAAFNVTALIRLSGGTRLATRACDVGICTARLIPLTRESAMICHAWTTPVIASAASVMFVTICSANIQASILRRSMRSTSSPAKGGMNKSGIMAANVTRPTNAEESKRANTRVPRATISAQSAPPDDMVAIHIKRKSRKERAGRYRDEIGWPAFARFKRCRPHKVYFPFITPEDVAGRFSMRRPPLHYGWPSGVWP